ncbi:MAG: hypothetical protein IGS48_14925 [Oscillatoriales cyanobacterium C42_A2020_001]|nr:hypothetical protein [Leptolyngbyaceae cyanobacterium C42_A2020_001]
MSWKQGHRLVYVRDGGCSQAALANPLRAYVKEQQQGWVTVVCPDTWIVVSRYQEQFEKDGWQLEESHELEPACRNGATHFSNN